MAGNFIWKGAVTLCVATTTVASAFALTTAYSTTQRAMKGEEINYPKIPNVSSLSFFPPQISDFVLYRFLHQKKTNWHQLSGLISYLLKEELVFHLLLGDNKHHHKMISKMNQKCRSKLGKKEKKRGNKTKSKFFFFNTERRRHFFKKINLSKIKK